MKKVLFASLFFICLVSSIQAQSEFSYKNRFNYGIGTDIVDVPLTENGILASNLGIHIGYNVTDRLNARLLFQGTTLKNDALGTYKNMTGLAVELGYYIHETGDGNFQTEIAGKFYNSFTEFSKLQNYQADLAARIYFFRTFYIGTGLRYSHSAVNNHLSISSSNQSSLLWLWQLGFQLHIGKSKR